MKAFRAAALALALGAISNITFAQTVPAAPRQPAKNRTFYGIINVVKDETVTMTPGKATTPVIFTLVKRTKIFRLTPGALSDIQLNEPVQVFGRVSASGTTMEARRIVILGLVAPKLNHESIGKNNRQLRGVVSSLSPLQVTVGNNPPVIVTLNTQTKTKVYQMSPEGASDVTVGANALATLASRPAGLVARRIVILPSTP